MDLRKTVKGDLPFIARIYQEEFSKPPYNEPWKKGDALKKMKTFFRTQDCYTIIINKEIIGFIVINPHFFCPGTVAFGEELAITEKYQARGIGTKVLKKIFEMYKKRGFKVFMGISLQGSGAYRLYSRLGITPSKVNVLLEKEL